MDRVSYWINQYLEREPDRWSTLTRDEHQTLADICREIKRRLGHEIDLWHRIMNQHIDRFHQLGDLEAKARERNAGKSD
jgi:hypothetical protein